MFTLLRNFLNDLSAETPAGGKESEQHQLRMAVAGLLHEMMRVDLKVRPEESARAIAALTEMFGLSESEGKMLLEEAGAHRFTSYFGPVSIIKRLLSTGQRVALIEQLWRVAFADSELDVYEDHFVRKIAHLLYVSNTDAMLARQRAKKT